MPKKQIVLDTNTLLSGLIWPDSIPAKAVAKALKEIVLVSEEVVREFRETISRPKFDKLKPLAKRLEGFEKALQRCKMVEVSIFVQACRDPKDDKFLALAKAANAMLIVSGDKDLLDMNPWEGIPILTARQFLENE